MTFWERAREMTVLLDRVLQDDVFGPRIDHTRIGAAGFSLGGNTISAVSSQCKVDMGLFDAESVSASRGQIG